MRDGHSAVSLDVPIPFLRFSDKKSGALEIPEELHLLLFLLLEKYKGEAVVYPQKPQKGKETLCLMIGVVLEKSQLHIFFPKIDFKRKLSEKIFLILTLIGHTNPTSIPSGTEPITINLDLSSIATKKILAPIIFRRDGLVSVKSRRK